MLARGDNAEKYRIYVKLGLSAAIAMTFQVEYVHCYAQPLMNELASASSFING